MHINVPINISDAIQHLPLRQKLQLVRQLEQETLAARLDNVVSRIRTKRPIQQLSVAEITRIVEDVRKTGMSAPRTLTPTAFLYHLSSK